MEREKNRLIYLKKNPVGIPTEDDFELVEEAMPAPRDGEVLVRNRYISVDPYMRGRIGAGKTYADNWKPGEPMRGGCVGEVVESESELLNPGDHVVGGLGWREYFISRANHLERVDAEAAPLSAYLGVLGMPGMTAFVGFEKLAQPEGGRTIFVSGAAGAVGSMVCALAKLRGLRVIGSAGTDRKIGWLRETVGADAAINYRRESDLIAAVAKAAPDGLDIYFDNVGGTHLEAALESLNHHGTVISCGMISAYNATEPPAAPRNLFKIVGSRLTIRGFIVGDHWEHRDEFLRVVAPKVGSGEIPYEETVVDGLESAPRAFIGLFKGENLGKMVVKLA
jgi:hypothetical protein